MPFLPESLWFFYVPHGVKVEAGTTPIELTITGAASAEEEEGPDTTMHGEEAYITHD